MALNTDPAACPMVACEKLCDARTCSCAPCACPECVQRRFTAAKARLQGKPPKPVQLQLGDVA
jgi:hypothetical protein